VIGSGIMGSGIAAHLANAGIPSLLLDLASDDPGAPRDALARRAIEQALKARPAAFFTPRAARLVTPGTIEDDLPKLAEVDWVVEAAVERLDVKRDLFARLATVVGSETIVSSNTSGLPASEMVAGLSEDFRRRFLVTHFFNPVRYMKLLELVPGPGTDPRVVEAMAQFGNLTLGKGVVIGKDTPNFIANRIGIYGFMAVMHRMADEGFTVEEVDTILGPALGRPKSAVFRTADLAGLDTLLHVAKNLRANAPEDECSAVFEIPDFLRDMVERGWLGEKAGQGFYKRVKVDGESQILALDLKTMEYRPAERPRFSTLDDAKDVADTGERLRRIVDGSDRVARFAWEALSDTLVYTANRLSPPHPIADAVESVDDAMRWGFNWELGPFQTWDALGVHWVADRVQAEQRTVPKLVQRVLDDSSSFYGGDGTSHRTVFALSTGTHQPLSQTSGILSVAQAKHRRSGAMIAENRGATLFDLGDGVACLELHTKLNAIDSDIIKMLADAIGEAGVRYRGLVLATDAADFSVGANLVMLLMASRLRQWKEIERQIKALQDAHQQLKYSTIPVVAAAAGRALGGGCEIMMHATRVRAHAELYCGLVEVGAGLIPAGGGCKELLLRHGAATAKSGPFAAVRSAFEIIAVAKVSTSAEEARDLRFLRVADPVTFDRDRLLTDAKHDVFDLLDAGYTPPVPSVLRLPGEGARLVLEQQVAGFQAIGSISEHDALVAGKLALVLSGGNASPISPVSEQDVLDLEREAFLSLCGMAKTQARMSALLQTGKPLRN
jgi:3-hydroxyacyl-CoA dehydrogenase